MRGNISIQAAAVGLASCVPADATGRAGSGAGSGLPDSLPSLAWSDPGHLPLATAGIPNAPFLLAGPDGVHLAYHAEISGRPADVHVARLGAGGWEPPENVSRSETPSSLPRLAWGPGRELHAVWGERTSDPTPRPGAPPTAIHHSVRSGGVWAPPVEVFRTPHEGVRPPESLVVDASGELHLVFAARELVTRRMTVYHARRGKEGWSAPAAVTGGLDPDLALGPDGALHLVYLEGDSTAGRMAPRDVNSIFAIRSEDGGRSWSAPVRVRRSGLAPAHRPRLATVGGELHLLWLQAADASDIYPDVVLHARSGDGLTWTDPVLVSRGVRGVPSSLEVAVEADEALHVTFQVAAGVGSGPYRPFHAIWRNDAWSAPVHLFGVERGSQRISIAVGGGEAHLVLGAGDLPSGAGLYHGRLGLPSPGP